MVRRNRSDRCRIATVTSSANTATENVHTAARTALSPSRMLGRTRSVRLRIVAVNAPTTKPIWTVPVSHTGFESFSIKSCCMLGTTAETENHTASESTCVWAIRARWEDGWPSRRARSLDRGDVALMRVRLPSGSLPHVSVSQHSSPDRVSPSPPIAPGSGQGEEQLLHVLLVESRVGAGQALLEARGDDREAGPVQGLGHRGELGDDVPA